MTLNPKRDLILKSPEVLWSRHCYGTVRAGDDSTLGCGMQPFPATPLGSKLLIKAGLSPAALLPSAAVTRHR